MPIQEKCQKDIKLRRAVSFSPVGAAAEGWKNSMKGTKTHFTNKKVLLLHEFFKGRRACDVYFKLNSTNARVSFVWKRHKQLGNRS